jgi:radical SAM protein with 4Fe4S-binding SPASM domain
MSYLNNRYVIHDEKFNFKTYFDRNKGYYLRTGILDEKGKDTDVEPFMASFPHLLDIGIMGHCTHGLSGKCILAGIQCYQSGSKINAPNMTLEDFKTIVVQCEGKVQQFALGGRGDPDMHEKFEEILKLSREFGIVPNITTSGYGLTPKKAAIIAKYCGAAAVSWYRTEYTYKAIDMLLGEGITTNIHYVLGKDSIDEAINLLRSGELPQGISRIVFLLFKPVGQGNTANMLSASDERVKILFSMFDSPEVISLVGYDSCSVPALVNNCSNIDYRSFDCCEGARFSAYISSDMKMTPCSFDSAGEYSVSLKGMTLLQAWESIEFDRFRNKLKNACPDCNKKDICMGGCPIVSGIVLCEKRRV